MSVENAHPIDDAVEHALELARAEISKVIPNSVKQENATNIITNAVSFADNVLKRLVAHTMNIDIDELFDEISETRGEILIESNGEKYTLSLDIVPHDYMLDLMHFDGHSGVKERIIFLLNTVKVLYCTIRDYMQNKLGYTEFDYVLQIGLNTTLFLDHKTQKRIGIILKKLRE